MKCVTHPHAPPLVYGPYKRAETISLPLSITKIVSLFVMGHPVCPRVFMLLFTRGSFGTLSRTDKKFIIKTKAFETKQRMLQERYPPPQEPLGPNPGQIPL